MTALPKFGNIDDLVCPGCGNQFLHHGAINVFTRANEDAPTVLVTKVYASGHASEHAEMSCASRNPSARRDGLAIEFTCETCPVISELTISQHKGHTLVAWRPAEARPQAITKLVRS